MIDKFNLDGLPKGLLENIVDYLDDDSLRNLQQFENRALFFTSAKIYFTRVKAEQLQYHLMRWEYNEVKDLVEKDPSALFVRRPYKPNRRVNVQYPPRMLSALEFVWLIGDPNFIVMFENILKARGIPFNAKHKAALTHEFMLKRQELVDAINSFAHTKDWNAFKPFWDKTPHWLHTVEHYLHQQNITNPDAVNVFDNSFRELTRNLAWGGWKVGCEFKKRATGAAGIATGFTAYLSKPLNYETTPEQAQTNGSDRSLNRGKK